MSDQSTQQNPFTTRRFIVAVIVVGIIAICAVIVIISNLSGGNASQSPTPASTHPAASTPAAATDPDPSTCGLGGATNSGTLSEAPKTAWVLFGRFAVPNDPKSFGPGHIVSNGVRTCYAHNPTGVLYATANLIGMGTDRTIAVEVIKAMVEPGAGRDAAIAAAQGSTGGNGTLTFQVAGFKINSYDGQTASIDIALHSSDNSFVSLVYDWQWKDGDWKGVLTSAGQPRVAPAQVSNLGGYIPWAGA